MTRSNTWWMLAAAMLCCGCGVRDCLPVPAADDTPPDVAVTVEYRDAATRRIVARTVSVRDTALVVEVDASAPLRVVFRASDEQGLRRLFPGVAVHRTVGMGVERRAVRVPPVEASCPRAELIEVESFPALDRRRELVLTAAAESWGGQRAATPPLAVRLR